MPRNLVIVPEAEEDLAKAKRWYDDQRMGLGQEFLQHVEQVFDRIRQWPEMHAVVREDVRQALVKRFPYVVCYRIVRNTIRVIAVYHGHRDPNTWQSRS